MKKHYTLFSVKRDNRQKKKEKGAKDMEKLESKRGITLVALIITIIVLLILVGITINLTIGDGGIIKRAEESSDQYKISEYIERLKLEVISKPDMLSKEKLSEYISRVEEKGIIEKNKTIYDEENNIYYVEVKEGYVFKIQEEPEDNIIIEQQLEQVNLKDWFKKLEVVKLTTRMIVIEIKDIENANSYTYKIKEKDGLDYSEGVTIKVNTYCFENLQPNQIYDVKVIIETDNKKIEIDKQVATEKVITLVENGVINNEVTGGFNERNMTASSNSAKVYLRDGYIDLDAPNSSAAGYIMKKPITSELLEKYNKVYCEYEIVATYDEFGQYTYANYGAARIGVVNQNNSVIKWSPVTNETKETKKRIIVELDISDCEGQYLAIQAHRCRMYAYNIWFDN